MSFNEYWSDKMSYEKTTTYVASQKVPYTHMNLMCPTQILLPTTLYTGGTLISNVTRYAFYKAHLTGEMGTHYLV